MARGELPGGDARADPVGGGPVLGRAGLELPVGRAETLARGDGRARVDRAGLAAGVWRRWADAGAGDRAQGRNGGDRGAAAARKLRDLDARAGAAQVRDRGAEKALSA